MHVGNFSLRAKGAFQHGVPAKLSNGLVRNGHQVIDFSDRDEARARGLIGVRELGLAAANRALRQLCHDVAPDLLLLGHADVIRPQTLAEIRAELPRLRIVQWNVDPMFEAENVTRLRGKLEVVDATLISTAGEALLPLRRAGMLLGFMPNPVDFSIESGRADTHDALTYDLFYACRDPNRPPRHVFGRDWDMNAFMRMVHAAIPGLKSLLPGMFGQPTLAGAAYQAALEASAVGLNISRRNDVPLYSSDRLAHMIGNGEAVLLDRATGYDALLGEDDVLFFSSFEELVAKLRRAIAEPAWRRAVAARGRLRYHELFNETLVARYVVEVATGTINPADWPWPTLVG